MSAATSTTPSGHETNGQFARGNRGGPGNPFARQTAALRQALVNAVTEKDIEGIAYALILKAQGGDLAASKLLFQYVLGKPQPLVNPDTLDLQELQQWQAESVPAETIRDFTTQIPAEGALIYMQAVAPCVTEQFLETITAPPAPEEAAVEETPPPPAPPRPHGKPSANGSHGHRAPAAAADAAAASQASPSPNGSIGQAFDCFSGWLRGRTAPPAATPQP